MRNTVEQRPSHAFAFMGSVAVTLRVTRASLVSTRLTVFASLKSAVLSTSRSPKVQLGHELTLEGDVGHVEAFQRPLV